MPQTNVDIVTIHNEADLQEVSNLTGENIHVTQGRKTTFENLVQRILAFVTAPFVRDLLQTLTGDDRLDASAIKNLPQGGATIQTQFFTNQTRTVLTVPGMTENPEYVAVYVDRDRLFPTEFTPGTDQITFSPMLIEQSVLIDFIPS